MTAATAPKRTAAQAADDRAKLVALATRQREELRAAAIDAFERLGAGIVAYHEKRWPWTPETDAAPSDPMQWKRLPRLLFLYCQVSTLVRQLDWLAISPGRPYWCPACSGPQENRPQDYYVGECPEHTSAPSMAINIGETLFGGGK